MYHHDGQNGDTVSTQHIANSHRLLSPTGDNVSPPPFLPDELIEKILLRLPVKHLLQFMCVCKLWKTLISDSQFAMKHLLCSTSDPSLTHKRVACAFRTLPKEIVSYPLNSLFENPTTLVKPDCFNNLKREYDIVGSCNGLLCLYDIGSCNRFILYNPSIKLKSRETPRPAPPGWFVAGIKGFCYDQVNGKYKVLAVFKNVISDEIMTKIYTCGEDSWRTIPNSPCSPVWRLHCGSGKYVSSTLNWVSSRKWNVPTNQHTILSFDAETETYQELLMPQNVGDDYKLWTLIQYDSSNCLCVCFEGQTHWVVWLMKEYGVVESWTKLMTIPREKFISDPFKKILFISENGVLLMSTASQLILYNINSVEFDYPSISTPQKRLLDSYYITCIFVPHIYHESLISPPRW